MTSALIGSTGFVGGVISSKVEFTNFFHSTNIHAIRGEKYDLIVCAAAPGKKWEANKYPEKDAVSIKILKDNLSSVIADNFILISTIDVYPKPYLVDEASIIGEDQLQPYGRHRYELEKFVAGSFPQHTIIRLPALFGPGLKKNFIFDLIHKTNLHLTHYQSIFQFYDMNEIWKDIQVAVENSIHLINFATEPIQVQELVKYVLNEDFTNITDNPPITYDFRTLNGNIYNSRTQYLYSKVDMLRRLKKFIRSSI